MKIIICCSISAADEVIASQKGLEAAGHEVEIPWGVHQYIENGHEHKPESERAQDKKEHDLIRRYFELIKAYDAVLVVNPEKKGIPGYIGGNTFLEMGFAYVLDKPLYVLNPLPDVGYRSELDAMNPVVLDGDVSRLSKLPTTPKREFKNETTSFSFIVKPSLVAPGGVGVFALHDIAAGTHMALFLDDFEEVEYETNEVPEELEGYCLNQENGKILCPKYFNRLDIGNYLNHSTNANVRYESGPGYFAMRDIVAGEEILANYQELGEPVDTWAEYYTKS